MKQQTRIFLVRHGESDHNVSGLVSGHSNPRLTKKGRSQALRVRKSLADIEFDEVYSSPLDRAIDTAEIIAQKKVSAANQKLEFRERNFGSLESQPNEELHRGNIKKIEMPHEQAWHFKHVPEMESDYEIAERFVEGLENLVKKHPGKTLLVVAHGGTIRATIMKTNNLTNQDLEPGSIKNADVVERGIVNGQLKALRLNGENINGPR